MIAKLWLSYGIQAVVLCAVLFGTAGTFHWPAAWVFLTWYFILTIPMGLMLSRLDPALLEERMKPLIQKDQPRWDRVLVVLLFAALALWLPLLGLDAVRYRWSEMPVWLQVAGGLIATAGLAIMWRTMRENTFLAPVVRIQRERGHKVISTGPYAIVRHPLYAGCLLFFPGIALMLGSWYGVLWSFVLLAILAVRLVKEERELERGLEGYPDYMRRVRYRLAPGVW